VNVPVKVLLVSPFPPPPSGIGRWAVHITQAGETRPDEVFFRCLDISPRWREVHDMQLWKRVVGGGLQMIRDVLRFVGMLCPRPDVVHLNSHGQLAPFRDIPILSMCRILGIPSVYHMHFGRIPEIACNQTREWKLLRLSLRLAHIIIAVDRRTFETLERNIPGSRVRLLPNCIDVASLPGQSTCTTLTPFLLYLGHVIPTKGIGDMMAAWHALSPKGWQLFIVGTVDEVYQRELEQHWPCPTVKFLGEVSHVKAMDLLAQSEGLVLPSHTEGFPNVIVEAMALRKPVIGTDVGAIPDMLADGCGIVVPSSNVKKLKDAILRLTSDPDIRRTLGARARDRACAEYTVDKVFERLLAIWHDGRREDTA
jgi:glycosyltransferase involved in cell wall biosynthesis